MAKVSHTPGPWTLDERYPDKITAGNREIAEAHGARWSGCGLNETYEVPSEVLANARLIAAAPAMLEALEMALEDMSRMGWAAQVRPKLRGSYHKAEAAIRLAKGDSR